MYSTLCFFLPLFVLICSCNCVLNRRNTLSEEIKRDVNENIGFYFYTRNDMDYGRRMTLSDFQTFDNNYFNKTRNTILVIHGFRHCKDADWLIHLRKALCMIDKWNVIVVDWSALAKTKYAEARQNTRIVGKHVAKFCDTLAENGVSPATIHIIGHSLGAHIAGYAGNNILYGKIRRITGLDPARPLFEYPILVSNDRRLDVTDAMFVDVIHTNAGRLGCKTAIGHVDFYPNGGSSQPGCHSWKCSHLRACDFWTQTITNPMSYLAYKCDSYDDFEEGHFNNGNRIPMGMNTQPNSRGIYCLNTTDVDSNEQLI